jgi:hypothetical protein
MSKPQNNHSERPDFLQQTPTSVFEDDMEKAVETVIRVMGPMGRLEYPLTKSIWPNAKVSTERHGVLWYGDVDMTPNLKPAMQSIGYKLGKLAELFHAEVKVTAENGQALSAEPIL